MLEDLKSLLGLPEDADEGLDRRLNLILSGTKSRLKSLLGGIEPPEELNYIILEVSVIRYNRIGSEACLLIPSKGRVSRFLLMISLGIVMIFRIFWTDNRMHQKVR